MAKAAYTEMQEKMEELRGNLQKKIEIARKCYILLLSSIADCALILKESYGLKAKSSEIGPLIAKNPIDSLRIRESEFVLDIQKIHYILGNPIYLHKD